MDVTIWATLDERAAASRGDLVVHWFRTAIDFLFSDGAKGLRESYAVVAESRGGGRDIRLKDVRENWPSLADALRPNPFHACVGFHEPSADEDEWVDDHGQVGSRHRGRGGTHTELSASLRGGDRIADPDFCSRLLDFLAAALDGADPVFARVDHLNVHDTSDLEAALGRTHRRYLAESRTHLRGYSWVTGVPAELAARLGGALGLTATGAFHAVRELRCGGLLLQATETLAGYDDRAMRAVFHTLAPVLPPGIPQDDPARPDLRVVFEDASGI
ncbi:hypothetical protein [Streptomyces cylindrosporus]|uniref:Uncharacterized protein n=1 Tax=Streptomyces cylindrosporus TaxID=2927583 RepID=A0ABS9YH73_9ACTN|nr:hypothetical protein [Streptomyces cylindrosporus]MCI3276574.1 hypothetical protein [Streptomyces cylindrosporus]